MARSGTLCAFRFALAFALSVPLISHQGEDPYFSLTTSQSFAPGAEAAVEMSAYGISSLRFRVYRVEDPVQFLRQLRDPHQFGGSYTMHGGKQTLLERLHVWKSNLRRQIRQNLRAEFTESPSQHLSFLKPSTPHGSKPTYYAEAPLLNSRQLVLSFLQPITKTTNRWDTQQVKIPLKQRGLFVVEAVNGDLRAYTLLSISDIAMVTKSIGGHVLYYVANRTTGEPVANASITTMERNQQGRNVTTNADGVAEFSMIPKATQTDDLRAMALSEGNVAFGDIGAWSFNQRERSLNGVLYTDRPVYRPGDTVHFRGILRDRQTSGYHVPAGESFHIQIQDRDGKPVYQKDLLSNTYGVIHDELILSKDAPLGNYFIQLQSNATFLSGNFDVQEYKKPEYEVHVTPEKRRLLQGETTSVTIDSRYFFGEPVTNAKVTYSIYKSRYWFPLWYDSEAIDEGQPAEQNAEPDDYGGGDQQSNVSGKLDADGKLVIQLNTEVTKDHTDTLYRIEAGVTDAAGREISGTGWTIATYGLFVINLEPQQWLYRPGDTAKFKMLARDYDNKPVATPGSVALYRFDWRNHKEGEKVTENAVTIDASGEAIAALKLPAEGGEYLVVGQAPSAGRMVETKQYLWVYGGSQRWDAGESQSIQIIPDKKSYNPGDTAKVMIATGPGNTPVLVTVEGRDIRSHTLLHSQNGSVIFSTPVEVSTEPDLFVTAQYFRNGKYFEGTKRIPVPPNDHKLNIKLSTDQEQYKPGDTAKYKIDVKTPDGRPVPQADFSLGVVDEAIYSIEKDATPELLDVFFAPEYNQVSSQTSLNYYFTGEAGTRRMRLAMFSQATRLAQLKPEQLVHPKVRKYFPDTAFWNSDITTDNDGHAEAEVTFPDSLTTWRATARGASLDDRYGQSQLKTIVRKNLMVRLAAPRFLIQGDEVVISAIVHNYLSSDKQATVNLKLSGLGLLSGALSQHVAVPQKGEAKVDFRIKAERVSQATIEAQALTNEESDALQIDLPIHPPGLPIRDPKSGSITNTGTSDFTVSYPNDSVLGSRTLDIRLTPSIVGSIFSALDYLTSYPYGCVEQTMSSFVPDVVVTQAIRELNLKQPIDQGQLNLKIQAGLDRLGQFHHEDGGWGWWMTDDSHPFMTAYVVAGLSQARAAGIRIDVSLVNSGAQWLTRYLDAHKDLPPDLKAYMIYALANAGLSITNRVNTLYSERGNLSPYGLAILGLTLDAIHDARANQVAVQLEAKVQQNNAEAYWSASRDEMLDFSADIAPEATAFATKLLSKLHPTSPLLPKAALWLVDHRSEGYWWSSTKQTAMVIYGLIDYIKASHQLNPDLTATVLVNGAAAASIKFDSGDPAKIYTVTLDEAKLNASNDRIRVESSGTGTLYYSISANHFSNSATTQKQGAVSLNLLRDYYRLTPTATTPILYDLQPLTGDVAQGDVLAVRLTLTGSDWRYLLIEDPIPAGTEFVKDENLYHLNNKPVWWSSWFTERENHDDRIALFQGFFDRGQTQYFYLLKVVNPGSFQVAPARVQPMYQPENQATTGATALEVK